MAAPLSTWLCDNLGSYKYILYAPLVGKGLYSWAQEDGQKFDWCFHVLMLSALRGLVYQLWSSFTNLLFLNRNRLIIKHGVDFKQIDLEWHWDNFIILHALMAAMACYAFPLIGSLVPMNWKGCVLALLLHFGISEPLYYWIHKQLHTGGLFTYYHILHHSSEVPQPFTAGNLTPLEHLILTMVMAIPIAGPFSIGSGSVGLIYGYILIFDFLRCMGHCNVEVVPHRLFEMFPFLKFLLYTPTYHSLHHMDTSTNFCLFMPLFDWLGNTLNCESWELHKMISSEKSSQVPEFVFLCHAVDVLSSLHAPFVLRSFSSLPFTPRFFLLPLWPGAFVVMLLMWALSKTSVMFFYNLRDRLFQTWVVPRYGFQYFLPFATDGINYQIEQAILRANKLGVKVISLAALNKNESLNGGGALFVKKHPNLNVRVVHGNTLTAAVILNEIDNNVEEVVLIGATSKLGRAIALYLCQKRTRVIMLTQSADRFEAVMREAPKQYQHYLVHVTSFKDTRSCKTWIVGKWLSPRQQMWAPKGTHFHQFVVPPILSLRRDCTYGKLAAMRLPDDVHGLGTCEYTLGRGVIHACHAGGVVHFLEGWTHHEVGAIEVDRIDVVWKAALKHGLKPV